LDDRRSKKHLCALDRHVRCAVHTIAGRSGFDVAISSGQTVNQRVSGSSPERPTAITAKAMGESHFMLYSRFIDLRP
jgi:hypothetical protein